MARLEGGEGVVRRAIMAASAALALVGAGCSDDGLGADHPSKTTITTVAGTGEAVLATDGVPATDATLLDPQSVVVDAQGNISSAMRPAMWCTGSTGRPVS
jgi:hypothetical protein